MANGILDRVRKVADNPFVTGILGTAALGFNPALGILGGPIIKRSRNRRDLENRKLELEIEDLEREAAALDRLPEVLKARQVGEAGPGVGVLSPQVLDEQAAQRDADVLGVLGELSPQLTAQGILQKDLQRDPAIVQTADAFGFERTPEGFAEMAKTKGLSGGKSGLEQMVLLQQLEKLIRENRIGAFEEGTAASGRVNSIQDSLDTTLRLLDANEQLDGSFLEPGGAFLEGKRTGLAAVTQLGNLFGFDMGEQQDTLEAFDTLKKETRVLAGQTIESMNAQGITVTNGLRNLVQEANASENVSPGTNVSILKVLMKEQLRAADELNIDIKNRKKIESELEKLNKTTMEFATEAEALTAVGAGAIQDGDTIIIDGVEHVWESD